MNTFQPITYEYIRRFSIFIFLAIFAWMFFYFPSDIYEIQVKNYVKSYQDKMKKGFIDPSKTSLNDYIAKEMKGFYNRSNKEKNIIEVEGEHSKFLNHVLNAHQGNLIDSDINKHRSHNTFWSGDSYFFRSSELPEKFLSQTYLKHPDYLMSKDGDGQKNYFKLHKIERSSMMDDVPVSLAYPLRRYSYLLIVFSLFVYLILPKLKIPEGAAFYTRLNTVYLPDVLSVFLWVGGWMFFFLPDDSAPVIVRYLFLLFFVVFSLAIVLPTINYASRWYLFTEDLFEWSGSNGVESVYLKDIVSIKPYKRQLPKWVAWLIILLGRGQPGATGIGMITGTSAPEVGMDITTKSGKKIRVMANYLESDEVFTETFQDLEKKLNNE